MNRLRVVIAVVSLAACKPSGESTAPTATSVASAAPSVTPGASSSAASTASATPTATAAAADASLDRARCDVKGEFSLTDVLSDPSCALANDDPQVKAAMEGKRTAGALDVEVTPRAVPVKGGAPIELDAKLTNRGASPLTLVVIVRPTEWFALDARAKGADAPDRLVGRRGPTFAAAEVRPAWWARITMAPGAVGTTRVAAIASSSRVEHLAGGPGTPAPYAKVEAPLAAGAYALDVTEPLLGTTVKDRATLTVGR